MNGKKFLNFIINRFRRLQRFETKRIFLIFDCLFFENFLLTITHSLIT